jgi:DNA-binding response OmpR family regulator
MNEVILVIDDDVEFTAYLQVCLEKMGYCVVTAPDGASGLRMARDLRPDAITLDVMMPGLDGWETCRRLKAMCHAPIIMLSARGRVGDVVHGLENGADDYLIKPFNTRELHARLAALLRRTGVASSVQREGAHAYGPAA